MANHYQQRARVSPPHVSMGTMRAACGLTLDQVCQRFEDATGKQLTRGALSAIESGLRGASADVLAGLAAAYGITAAAIDTQYEPKRWTESAA